MNPYDESVGTMLPQVDINGVPLTKEVFIREWDESGDVVDPDDSVPVDYISSETQFLLSSINKMKYKLYAVRLLPFTHENYVKEFDIVRNLVSLQKKLRSVIAHSSDETKRAIEYVTNVGTKERNKDIDRLMNAINVQEIKATGVATSTMIKANALYNNDAKFIERDTKSIIKPFNRDYELELLSTEELERDYPVGKKLADEYVEIFNHLVNLASNTDSKGYITSFEKEDDDSLLILGCRLLEVIPVEGVKNYLSVYKDVVIGKYDRICDIIDENNTKKYQIQVECSRCPKTGNFCIYLIMKANIITGEEHHGEEFDNPEYTREFVNPLKIKTDDLDKDTVRVTPIGLAINSNGANKNFYIFRTRKFKMEVDQLTAKLEDLKSQYEKTHDDKYKNKIEKIERSIKDFEAKIDKNVKILKDSYDYTFTESSTYDSDIDMMGLNAFAEAMEDNMSTDYCYDILLESMSDYM